MSARMRSVCVAIGGAILIVGTVFGSNMGFKIHYIMEGEAAGSATGKNMMSLPYIPKIGLVDASDLLNDIEAKAGGDVVYSVSHHDGATGWTGYTGTSGVPFILVPGEGYLVQLEASVGTIDYVIVGSHDPNVWVTLTGQEAGGSGENALAIPYHSLASNAAELMDEIDVQAGSPVALEVWQWDRQAGGWTSYNGTSGSPFALLPGDAYMVLVSQTTSYRPLHY